MIRVFIIAVYSCGLNFILEDMASLFNPGLLGVNSPQNCRPQFFVIINDKCLYYYKNETSKKPSGAVSLYGYNRDLNHVGPSNESTSSWGSSEYSCLEDAIYHEGVSEQSRNSTFSESSFDRISNKSEGSGKLLMELEKDDEEKPEIETKDYWSAIHFSGSKAEASSIIRGIKSNGVYLVRKSDDGLDEGQHTLSLASGPYFNTLEDMLFHYYTRPLPRTQHCLTLPYKLHPEFINNEKH
ncbi:hypothetical protein RRG08_035353 [Elysia crispata]|uniref:SH2 domain-containing protein n=1 Tax=Elysia crispata TaxID=231223 RepID=A0AAE0Y3L4_9GAST|nr:hypothetical protein RRG08_035353 [Elysia crispata]